MCWAPQCAPGARITSLCLLREAASQVSLFLYVLCFLYFVFCILYFMFFCILYFVSNHCSSHISSQLTHLTLPAVSTQTAALPSAGWSLQLSIHFDYHNHQDYRDHNDNHDHQDLEYITWSPSGCWYIRQMGPNHHQHHHQVLQNISCLTSFLDALASLDLKLSLSDNQRWWTMINDNQW